MTGSYVFKGVCLLTGGGYPSLRFFSRSLVLGPSQGYPIPGQGIPHPWLQGYLGGEYPSPAQSYFRLGYPLARSGWGTSPSPPSQVRSVWGTLQPNQDRLPPARSGCGTPWPDQDGELAMWRAVCLLHSRRKTSLSFEQTQKIRWVAFSKIYIHSFYCRRQGEVEWWW